jgi:hypothetical protein
VVPVEDEVVPAFSPPPSLKQAVTRSAAAAARTAGRLALAIIPIVIFLEQTILSMSEYTLP